MCSQAVSEVCISGSEGRRRKPSSSSAASSVSASSSEGLNDTVSRFLSGWLQFRSRRLKQNAHKSLSSSVRRTSPVDLPSISITNQPAEVPERLMTDEHSYTAFCGGLEPRLDSAGEPITWQQTMDDSQLQLNRLAKGKLVPNTPVVPTESNYAHPVLDNISHDLEVLIYSLKDENIPDDVTETKLSVVSEVETCCVCGRRGPSDIATSLATGEKLGEKNKIPKQHQLRVPELQTKVETLYQEIRFLRQMVEDLKFTLREAETESVWGKTRRIPAVGIQEEGQACQFHLRQLRTTLHDHVQTSLDGLVRDLRDISQRPARCPSFLETSLPLEVEEELLSTSHALKTATKELHKVKEELHTARVRLTIAEEDCYSSKKTLHEASETLQAANLQIHRLQVELQEAQTCWLFSEVELEDSQRSVRFLRQQLHVQAHDLQVAHRKLGEANSGKHQLIQELQTTRTLLAQCLARVRELEAPPTPLKKESSRSRHKHGCKTT